MNDRRNFFNAARLVRSVARTGARPRAVAIASGRTAALFALTTAMGVRLVQEQRRHPEDPTLGPRHMQVWCARVCRLFNVQRTVTGRVPSGSEWERSQRGRRGVLLVCNHRSYLDIPVVGAEVPAVFVAGAELLDWPVIGWGSQLAGTIFVDRADPDSRQKTRQAVLERLQLGLSVLNYPEGRTNLEEGLLPFNPGLFRMAAGLDVDLVPVSLAYPKDAGLEWGRGEGATFIEHVIEKAANGCLKARVHFGEPIRGTDHPDPAALLKLVRDRMLEDLSRLEG